MCMREIKFRSWDEESERMFYSDSEEDRDVYFFEFKDEVLRGFAIRPPQPSSDPMEPDEPYCDDYDVMQYTGVKDKHRKCVYQNDIVRCWKLQDTMHPEGHNHGTAGMIEGYATAVVEFNGWEFSFRQLSGSDWFFEAPDGRAFDPHCTRTQPSFEHEWMEIIGNVTDNPELLKE